MSVITRNDILDPGEMVANAAKEIRAAGAPASDALAALIDELLDCRNSGLIWALVASKEAVSTTQLRASVEAVVAASPVRQGRPGRFPPEIVGGGKIGLTDGRWEYVQKHAREALARLQVPE
jgi:hypothetical protein